MNGSLYIDSRSLGTFLDGQGSTGPASLNLTALQQGVELSLTFHLAQTQVKPLVLRNDPLRIRVDRMGNDLGRLWFWGVPCQNASMQEVRSRKFVQKQFRLLPANGVLRCLHDRQRTT